MSNYKYDQNHNHFQSVAVGKDAIYNVSIKRNINNPRAWINMVLIPDDWAASAIDISQWASMSILQASLMINGNLPILFRLVSGLSIFCMALMCLSIFKLTDDRYVRFCCYIRILILLFPYLLIPIFIW